VARLALIDTGTGTLVSQAINGTPTGCAAYGLGIDARNRVWLPGWSQGAIACRYDHTTGTWTKFDFTSARSQTNSSFGLGRGIAIDTGGRVYMSGYGGNTAQVIRFDAETGAIIPFGAAQFIDMSGPNTGGSIGVGLDADGHPWVNNYSGNVTKVDQMTGAVTRTAQQPGGLYTYSDFTGYQLRNFTAPRGTYRRDFEACANDNQWRELTWDAVVPANSTLQVFVKAANTLAELNAATLVRSGPFTTSPVDLIAAGVPQSRFLRVEFVLRSVDGQTSPVLRGFNVKWLCGGIN
jgi:streptogramin lyase